MRIVLVEDDYLQAETIRSKLVELIPTAKVERIKTEREFQTRLPGIVRHPPDAFVMDVMLQWTQATPTLAEESPPPVGYMGCYDAGLRCVELLAAQRETLMVPVVLYSVLPKQDAIRSLDHLGGHIVYVPKEEQFDELARALLRLVPRNRRRIEP